MKLHEEGNCTFINGDSLSDELAEYLKQFEGKADLVCMDPPYNIADKGKVTKAHGKIYSNREAWGDEFEDSFSPEEYDDLIRLFCTRAFTLLQDGCSLCSFIDRRYAGRFCDIAESVGFLYKGELTFVKVNCVPKVRTNSFGSSTERAVWLLKPNSGRTPGGSKVAPTKPRVFNSIPATPGPRFPSGDLDIKGYHNKCSSNVFFGNIGGNKRTGHPTEKYSWMLQPIIEHFSNKHEDGGGVVLDLCAGGFNSGLVCEELGRRYVGVELNPYFWEKGVGLLCHLIQSVKSGNVPWKPPRDLMIQPKAKR